MTTPGNRLLHTSRPLSSPVANRPLSPHLPLKKPQFSATFSISHRIFGVALGVAIISVPLATKFSLMFGVWERSAASYKKTALPISVTVLSSLVPCNAAFGLTSLSCLENFCNNQYYCYAMKISDASVIGVSNISARKFAPLWMYMVMRSADLAGKCISQLSW